VLPTVADCIKQGATIGQAHAKVVAEMAVQCGKPQDEVLALADAVLKAFTVNAAAGDPCDPYYKVQAVTPRGSFWAINRKFTRDPTKVLVSELTADEARKLLAVKPQFLAVSLVTYESAAG
jgi:hypothetical protein